MSVIAIIYQNLQFIPRIAEVFVSESTPPCRMTKKMYDAGIPILAGTDALPGIMLHRELELEVAAGIPPANALQIATLNAARLLKQDRDLGSVAPGNSPTFFSLKETRSNTSATSAVPALS
jgi:imidazolonepropionase-like amidohydrolase